MCELSLKPQLGAVYHFKQLTATIRAIPRRSVLFNQSLVADILSAPTTASLNLFPIYSILSVLLQNLIEQIVQYHRAGAGANHGHVLSLISSIDANEYAARISGHHHRSAGRAAF